MKFQRWWKGKTYMALYRPSNASCRSISPARRFLLSVKSTAMIWHLHTGALGDNCGPPPATYRVSFCPPNSPYQHREVMNSRGDLIPGIETTVSDARTAERR